MTLLIRWRQERQSMIKYSDLRLIVQSFEETKNLDIKDQDLPMVCQYIELKKDFDPNDITIRFEPVLRLEPYVFIEYIPSKTHQAYMKEKEKLSHIDTFYHSDYVIEATFEQFEPFNSERRLLLEKAKSFCEHFEKGKFIKGLYIFGQYRTGKTYLLSAIVNELAKKEVNSIFAYFPDLIRYLKSAISDHSLEEKVKALKTCDLLVLDDLGSENMTPWFRDEIFGPILQHRLSVGLPLLVSSNLNMKALISTYVDSGNETDQLKATRLVSRIYDLTEPVEMSQKRYK